MDDTTEPVIDATTPDPLAIALAERDRAIERAEHLEREAAARFRDLLLAGAPDVPADLVIGATMSEVEASFDDARALVASLRDSVAGQAPPPPPVSAGAPGRGIAQPRTPFEKIRAGLATLE